jgi:AcrR family transcriptional regulator
MADHTESRRKAILDSAMKLFDGQGYSATTMEEVAVGAGISKGSIYNYFHSKQDLFTLLFAEATMAEEAEVDRLIEQPTPAIAKMQAMLGFWFSRFEDNLRVGRLTLEFWATAARQERDGGLAEMLQAAYGRWLARVAKVIEQGIGSGEFLPHLDARTEATLFVGVIHGLMVHRLLRIGAEVDERLLASLKRSVLAGLGARLAQMPGGPSEGDASCEEQAS